MKKLSDLFRSFAQDYGVIRDSIDSGDSRKSLTALALQRLKPGAPPVMLNIMGLLVSWWPIKKRHVYRITPESAEFLRRVNLSFIPEKPPESWCGEAIVLESTTSKPIVENYFSVGAYRMQAMTSDEVRYYFVCLDKSGGATSFSVSTDTGKINDKMAKDELLLDTKLIGDSGLLSVFSQQEQITSLNVIRFVFAASYYIQKADELPHVNIERIPGPIRTNNGKTPKGTPSLWQYGDLRIDQPVKSRQGGIREALDKDNLSLEPTLVSPHIRRYGDHIIIIDAYGSHRWKKEVLGRKVKM